MGIPQGAGAIKRGPPWRLLVRLSVVLLLLGMTSSVHGLLRCHRPPRFSVNNVEPMVLAEGRVTLVALLTSNCRFCIGQAHGLEQLYQNLTVDGDDVHMMIINGGPRPAPGEDGTFERIVSFDVYHDDDRHQLWRQVFRGRKDDILIFNRCGLMTYRLPFPHSWLGYNYVSTALRYTDENHHICGNVPCNRPQNPNRRQDLHDRMMGDAPVPRRYGGMSRGETHSHRRAGHHARSSHGHLRPGRRRGNRRSRNNRRNLNRSRCPPADDLCWQLRRGQRRYNRFRTQHGFGPHTQGREQDILRMYGLGQRRGAAPVI